MAVTAAAPTKAPAKTAGSPAPKTQSRRTEPAPRSAQPPRTPVFLSTPSGKVQHGGGGAPLAPPVQSALENSLQVNLDNVRVHSDGDAQHVARSLSARAFTYGNHIFLGEGEKPTDLGLLGHEAAHVVQQQAAPALQKWSSAESSDTYEHEAHQASAAVLSGQTFTVHERTNQPRVQRSLLSRLLDKLANWAYNIPGFRLLTVIIGKNPINWEDVDRSAANILRGLVELMPGGHLIEQALDKYGVFEKLGGWLEQQVTRMASIGSAIKKDWDAFVDDLGWTDIRHPGKVWDDALGVFTRAIERIGRFAIDVARDILKFIKDAILMPLAKLAEGTRGWDLLIAVLGTNPITGEKVPQTAETLIGGFMKLIGQEEVWENIKKANALSRAWAWFRGAVKGLLSFVAQIPSLFIDALKSLSLEDIIVLPKAFIKVGKVFLGFIGNFISWAGEQVWTLLQIIFEVLAPAVMPYLKKAAAAFRTILKNPGAFVGNLVKAAKQGFLQFGSNFLTHLKASLIGWLTGTLEGANIYIPQGFAMMEIIKFVLSVLGLTWQNIRQKLVKAIGETAVKALEAGFDIVVTLVTKGPAAAWEKIQEGISNLKEMVMDGIMSFVKDRIVTAAVTKLISLLNPAGAFIQAIIATYNTIMFFVERLKQIAAVVAAFIDSISAIANGIIPAAANKVESTLGGLLTLVISFLARLVGLGKVSDAVKDIINKIRDPIDKALDKVIEWIVTMAKKAGKFIVGAVTGGGRPAAAQPSPAPLSAGDPSGVKALLRADLSGKSVSDSRQADQMLSSEFGRYSPQGLKGIRVAYNPKDPSELIILASASVTEEVARLPITATGARQALDYLYRFSFLNFRTVLYIYYDDGKRFGPVVTNQPDEPGKPHAEDIFERDYVGTLASQITAERTAGSLKTQAGQRVPVELDLNRLPCEHCSSLVPRLARRYPELAFVVKAATISNADVLQRSVPVDSEAHIEFIENMIAANVNVEPLAIFEAVWAKLLQVAHAVGAGKVRLRGESLALEIATARQLYEANLAETRRVKELIATAKQRAALAKIPVKGSAP